MEFFVGGSFEKKKKKQKTEIFSCTKNGQTLTWNESLSNAINDTHIYLYEIRWNMLK